MAPLGGLFDKLHPRKGAVDNLGATLLYQCILNERAAVLGEQSKSIVEAGFTRWCPVEEFKEPRMDLLMNVHRSRNPQRFQDRQLLRGKSIGMGGQFRQVLLGSLQRLPLLQEALSLLV